jgi:hypothetical protein
LDLEIQSLDYRFFMDALSYYHIFFPSPPLPEVLTEFHSTWDQIVQIPELNVRVNEGDKLLFCVHITDFLVQMCPLETRATGDRLFVEEHITSDSFAPLIDARGLLADVYTGKKVVTWNPNGVIHMKLEPINWFYRFFIYPVGEQEAMLKYEREIVTESIIEATYPEIALNLLPTDNDFGTCRTDNLHFFYHFVDKESTITLDFGPTKVTTDRLGVFHDFMKWESYRMILHGSKISMKWIGCEMGFHYDFFMAVFHYLMDLITIEKTDPDGPWRVSPYFFDIEWDKLTAQVISRKMDNVAQSLVFFFDGFTVKTESDPKIMFIRCPRLEVTTPSQRRVMTLDGLYIPLEYGLLDPALIPDADPIYLYVKKFITPVKVDRIVYIDSRQTTAVYLDIFQSFFSQEQPVYSDSPFVVEYDTIIDVSSFEMEWNDLS